MVRMIFPNIAVADLARSEAFYSGLGFPVNEIFSNEQASGVVVSNDIMIMLLSPGFANESGLAQPSGSPAVSLAISAESRAEVDSLAEKAIAGGGAVRGESHDLGFVYSRGITDPDGHFLDFVWMDPAATSGDVPAAH